MKTRVSSQQKGVTLMELMIVVAIIGIIAAVAYPSYQEFVMKSRRADGQAALMSFAGAMERYFTVNDTYCGAGPGSVAACSTGTPDAEVFVSEAPVDGDDKYYDLDLSVLTGTTFTVRAQPKGAQSTDSCGNLTVDQTGARTDQGTDCWP